MKPLISETQDAQALQQLGRASVQVVHDLKNQLNGLKLYATFLRKRLEKAGRPADELDTLAKLIEGLEQGAADAGLLVRFGRPLELSRKAGTDLAPLLARAVGNVPVEQGAGTFVGEFDGAALSEAFKLITSAGASSVRLRRAEGSGAPAATVEWAGAAPKIEGDAFNSFAGAAGMRLALAAKIIRAHGGEAAQEAGSLRVTLPLAP